MKIFIDYLINIGVRDKRVNRKDKRRCFIELIFIYLR